MLLVVSVVSYYKKKAKIEEQIEQLANNTLEMTPKEFLKMRKTSFGGQGRPLYALQFNFEGVYILFNKTKGKHYVGKGKQILNNVHQHFTGRGNGDVYADYVNGDDFTIKMIALENSGYTNIDDLKKDTITAYNAFSKGYNKKRK